MDAIRAFIAVDLSEELRRELDNITQRLQERCAALGGEKARKAVRWVPAANSHLTLKFLGEVSTGNLQSLARMLKSEARLHAPFEVQINGLGGFPNLRRPRVIWVGSETSPALISLQHAIEAETRALGYPSEERAFSPHLTLGRISQGASPQDATVVAQALASENIGSLGSICVDRVYLFRSELRPAGAIYSALQTFPLGN